VEINKTDLHNLFFPASIAMVGASNRFGKWGFNLSATLLVSPFSGPVYLVNPKDPLILGRRTFPNLKSLPEKVDLAVLAVPALQTISLIEECGDLGIPNALLVVASNFKEVGEEGARLEEKLIQTAEAGGVRIAGRATLAFFTRIGYTEWSSRATAGRSGGPGSGDSKFFLSDP
jgi:acyl-CoA synthetase (NDP forming)